LNKTKNNQSENGFRFDFEFDCVFPQVKVKAAGYEEKTVTILDGEERKVIYLDEIIQKGTIIFNTTNPDGIEANVEIILTDELGKASTYFTDYSGNKDYEIEAGEYEYSALSENSGEVITGDFEILGGERKTVNIAFTKTQDQINASDKKYFAFKVIDETAKPILFAKVRLYENGKSITFRDTRPNGKTNPITKTDFDESISYKAIVTSNGHALKIVDIVLQEKDAFQEIILNKGGSKINLTVVNDLYESEKDAFVTLNIAGFNASIYTGNTDRNGQISFENLSNGIFNLKASDKSKKDDATLDVVLGTNQTKDIQMVLTTGEGKIRFDFVDNKYNDIDTKYAFRDYNGTIINEGFSTRGYFRSNDLKKGTIVNLISNDSNYFYHQTLDYTISRTDQKKDVFIRKLDSLPNDQEIQMFLMQIYNSNPLYGKVSKASRIEQDQEYYLYFDLIIDNEEKNTVLANFEIENDSNKGITIEDVYSINPSQRVLSSIRGEQVIDKQNNQYLVDAAALQANLIVDEQQGKKSIPIILKIKVDINAEIESKSTIYFNSIHGTKNSLNYSKEIIIGEKFCLDDCPVFLFNNYLKWNDREYEVLYDDVSKRMLIDDDYTLKTTVTNKSDEDIGASKLVLTVPKEKMNYLKVEDTNTKSYDISLEALATSTSKETKITPLKKTNSGTLFEKVTKEENGIDQLLGYVGNNNSIRFKILEKEEIDISISPTSMSEGSRQFFFVIKTKYKSKYTGIPAHWYITKNGTRLGVGYEGETDINGIQVLTIDGSSFLEGDEIIFTAYDNTGAIDGTFPLEINDPFIEEIPQAPECITIELAGRDISEENNSLKKLNKNAQTALTFNSTCAEERTIYLHTDLLVTNNNFNIIPNGSEIIDITAKPRNDLLGVYPVQIISVDDATYKTLGVVDIEINDPHNHFTLSDAVFDFKNTQVNTATITNNNYAGRADNFNPQVVLNTESVSVQFTKPGLPEIYDYNLPVRATAIESITLGGTKSEILYSHLSEGNWSSDHTYAKRVEATAVIDSDVASRLCSSVTPEYEEYPKPEPDPPERIRNAIPTYTPSEILSDEGDSSDIIEGELSSKKEKKLLFTTHPGGYISNLRNPAADLEGVFTVNALPLTYGTGDANSTTKLLGSAPTISGNTVTYFWHPKYMDSFGTSTPGPIDTSEVSIFSEQLFGERCTKYNANDPYWRLTPFGNLNDVDKMNWKIISGKETRIVQLAGRVSQSTFLSDSEEYDSDTQFIATGAHENALKKSPVYWKNFVNGDCPTIGNCDDGKIKAQVDSSAAIEFLASIDEETIVPISIKPIEDVVYEVGSYRDFSIAPRWANVDTQFGDYESGDTFIKGNQLYTVGCITSSGIVSWEHAASVGHQNADGCNGMPIRPIIMDPNDPLVEYDSSGNIRYWVHPQDLPEDLNIYLYNGNVFAEYIGVSEVAGNNIDLTLTKNNLIGSEYAIVTVKDWVRNTSGKLEKKHQAFQVKLVGNTHNVYASDGTSGVTGEEFVPKLLFDWEWAHVPSIQCDSENYTYTYCDGVQFNISLFKRLVEIEDLLVKNQLQNIPAKTAFYSYLIKDNYNQALLNDFLEYYESSFLNAGATF
ncbi:MAG: hypothetical protein HN878_00290, partial [Candidatus Diapherotrites archaeon]|nr:hypothetical protein [Candidatus Diapherotrites archaeon]